MNPTKFYDSVRDTVFGGIVTGSQVSGTNTILSAWSRYEPTADPRWIAYSLGTAFWETGRTMQPVREVGEGRGRAYGHPAGPWNLVYYGRGDVQETWLANYESANVWLRQAGVITPGEDVAKTPDLMLQPTVASATLVLGMIQGRFTGRKLSQFFTSTRSDWIDARTIINGHDQAATVAGFGLHFYAGLTA